MGFYTFIFIHLNVCHVYFMQMLFCLCCLLIKKILNSKQASPAGTNKRNTTEQYTYIINGALFISYSYMLQQAVDRLT